MQVIRWMLITIRMARAKHNLTLSEETTAYLKKFSNMSKIVDEAIELHKVRDKLVMKPAKGEIISIIG